MQQETARRKTMRRLVAGVLAMGLLTTGFLPAGAEEPPGTPAEAGITTTSRLAVPAIDWAPCFTRWGPFECARVAVPLDYDKPNGAQIRLALTRLPASGDPAKKIGSLFLNPGGPGGSGVDFVVGAGQFLYSPKVRERFDLIGFDPRGIGRSRPLRCFDTIDEAFAAVSVPFTYPTTAGQVAQQDAANQRFVEACDRRATRIISHMSTANVARDLDLLRQAVGDARLTYAGYSYGTFIGATYANMFPDKVRAVVVDGVLDPVAWTTGRSAADRRLPFSSRLGSDVGAAATLRQFFATCDAAGPSGCAIAPDAGETYRRLARKARNGQLFFEDPFDGTRFPVPYDELVSITLGSMYGSDSWPGLAELLATLDRGDDPRRAGRLLADIEATTGVSLRHGYYQNFVEGFPGVSCTDSVNPAGIGAWSRAADLTERTNGRFGPLWTWASSACSRWNDMDADRYLGPFTNRTANPVLVVNPLYDPATPYEAAVILDDLLPNSHLLTVRSWGHTSLFTSFCADSVVSQYLLRPRQAPVTDFCRANVTPFEAFAGRSRLSAEQLQTLRAEAMREVALVPGG